MKKLFLIYVLFIALPVFASCPIGDGESVCTLPNGSANGQIAGMGLNSPNTNALNNNLVNPIGINNNANNGMPQMNTLQPSKLNNSFNSTQNQNGIQMNSSLGCQFGNCNKKANSDYLDNQ
jgi:hypothetical protein